MNLVYAKRDRDTFRVRINGTVGGQFDGVHFQRELDFINEQFPEAKEIQVRINSEGGSVINGLNAVAAILDSKIPVKTYNDGYAMSMAGVIWLCAEKENRYASNFSILMLHAPYLVSQGEAVEPENEDEKRFIQAVTLQLQTLLIDSTGKSKKEIFEILSKDSFYNSSQAVKEGFMNKENIIKFKRKPKNLGTDIKENIKQIAAFYDSNLNNNNQMELKDLKEMFSFFKATQEESKTVENYSDLEAKYKAVINDKAELETKLTEAENKIETLNSEVESYKGLKAELEAKKAEDKVNKAIEDGKVKKEQKEGLVKVAQETPDAFDAIINAVNLEVKAPNVQDSLTENVEAVAKEFGYEVVDFTFWNLYKDSKVEAVKAKYPSLVNKLEKEFENSK